MKQVEEALHRLHARDKEKQARDVAEAHQEAMSRSLSQSGGLSPTRAFAKVNSISPGSPASIAVSQGPATRLCPQWALWVGWPWDWEPWRGGPWEDRPRLSPCRGLLGFGEGALLPTKLAREGLGTDTR